MQLKMLSKDQIWGGQNLQAIRAQGGRPFVTDLCLGLGSWGDSLKDHNNVGSTLVDGYSYGSVCVWHQTGGSNSCGEDDPKYSIRPIIDGSDAEKVYQSAAVKKVEKINGYFVEVIQHGSYPQDVDWNYGELEQRYQNRTLQMTGRSFTFNGINVENDYGYIPYKSPEFVLNNRRYVRAIVSSFADCLYLDGRRASNGYPCWYRVQPIEWICEPNGLLISRKGLVAGIPFSVARDYVANTLSKEIEPSAPDTKSRAKYRIPPAQLLLRSGRTHT